MSSRIRRFFFALALTFVLAAGVPFGAARAAEGDVCNLDNGGGSGRIILGNGGREICISPEAADALAKCSGAGWRFLAVRSAISGNVFVFVNCGVDSRDFVKHSADNSVGDNVACGIYISVGSFSVPACSDIFGAGFRFPANDGGGDQTFIYNCPDGMIPDPDYVAGGVQDCIPWDNEKVCETILDGDIHRATGPEQTAETCSGTDNSDTFCLLGSDFAMPCRGLLQHAVQCNQEYNRPAENPFLCGEACSTSKVAIGGECKCGIGAMEIGGNCVIPE